VTVDILRKPRTAGLARTESATLAREENARFAALLASLDDADWSRPTDCPEWEVREVALHVLGAMEGHVRLWEMGRQIALGVSGSGALADRMSAVQVRERRHLTETQIVERVAEVGPRAATARASRPALMRWTPLPQRVGTSTEWWSLGYLLDVVLTRDVWMHRVDISRAVGRPVELTPEHDGRLVADVVADWALRHGQPFGLLLRGPAGGSFSAGHAGEQLEEDAVEFCRILSGRAPGEGLLSQPVPF